MTLKGMDENVATFGQDGRPDCLVEAGPMVVVWIGYDHEFHPGDRHGPNLSNTPYNAIVDTGTRDSCIDSDLATELNLPILGQRRLTGVNGSRTVNVYCAQVYFPDLGFLSSHQFPGANLGKPHHVLIGRDILQNFTMTYQGQTGVVSISRNPAGQ